MATPGRSSLGAAVRSDLGALGGGAGLGFSFTTLFYRFRPDAVWSDAGSFPQVEIGTPRSDDPPPTGIAFTDLFWDGNDPSGTAVGSFTTSANASQHHAMRVLRGAEVLNGAAFGSPVDENVVNNDSFSESQSLPLSATVTSGDTLTLEFSMFSAGQYNGPYVNDTGQTIRWVLDVFAGVSNAADTDDVDLTSAPDVATGFVGSFTWVYINSSGEPSDAAGNPITYPGGTRSVSVPIP
ncbi:MAG: hypothetical protein HRU13_09090 [Phycisphaerales bacterium]|nr:hypothetical protein [Phycisphaerales bacterium]